MNILMMTNTYLPHVGGVANSVSAFTKELQRLGHHVIVVAPEYQDAKLEYADVIRLPAIQHFNGSDFSMIIPVPFFIEDHLENFKPDIVHSHHPYLIGSTAVRISAKYNVPLVFTQHTMFEEYTHYVPMGFDRLKQFVISLSTGYANMSNLVIAPSESTASILSRRGIETPIEIIPTGINVEKLRIGDGQKVRAENGISPDAFVIGHLGRLAPEKNLDFLSSAAAAYLEKDTEAHFIVAGYGPSQEEMSIYFTQKNLQSRVHFIGKVQNQNVIDAYHAMDVFAFSSQSETQGLVLTEAMAAGIPVVAIDAPGVREVIKDGVNGFLLPEQNKQLFAEAIGKIRRMKPESRKKFSAQARKTAGKFSINVTTSKLLAVYEKLEQANIAKRNEYHSMWENSMEQIKAEWELLSNLTNAVEVAILDGDFEK